jgi:predicted phosphodiesterase
VRYLVLSDIHANWEALEAVAAETAGLYEQAICCGDVVGYGADPDRVSEWVRANCAVVVRGNHDKAATGLEDLEWFNPVARAAALWTMENLSAENREYIRTLARGPIVLDGFEVLHGAPFDEDEYVFAPGEAEQSFGYLERRLAFFGHTHLQGGFLWNHERIEAAPRIPARASRHAIEIEPSRGYLVNPGSVGQPRDGDPRAAYVLYDSEAESLSWQRVSYDVEAAQKKIRANGLPPILADRLAVGR